MNEREAEVTQASSPAEVAVSARSVSYCYGSHVALDEVSCEIEAGSITGLLGPNGSGKSTFFRLLATLLPLKPGSLLIHGLDVASQQHDVRRLLGVTFQSPALDSRLTTSENLWCHARLYGLNRAAARSRISKLLEQFRLRDVRDQLVSRLSGGLKRRVELARGLVHEPRVLLLDEPTNGLDPAATREFWDLVEVTVRDTGVTAIVSTHLMPEAERCDSLLLLCRGRVVASGSPSVLQEAVRHERLRIVARNTDQAERLISELTRAPVERDGETLTVRTANVVELLPLILARGDLQLQSVELQKPSLADVFFKLTGTVLHDGKS